MLVQLFTVLTLKCTFLSWSSRRRGALLNTAQLPDSFTIKWMCPTESCYAKHTLEDSVKAFKKSNAGHLMRMQSLGSLTLSSQSLGISQGDFLFDAAVTHRIWADTCLFIPVLSSFFFCMFFVSQIGWHCLKLAGQFRQDEWLWLNKNFFKSHYSPNTKSLALN